MSDKAKKVVQEWVKKYTSCWLFIGESDFRNPKYEKYDWMFHWSGALSKLNELVEYLDLDEEKVYIASTYDGCEIHFNLRESWTGLIQRIYEKYDRDIVDLLPDEPTEDWAWELRERLGLEDTRDPVCVL